MTRQCLAVLCKLARTPSARVPLLRAAPSVVALLQRHSALAEDSSHIVVHALWLLQAIATAGECPLRVAAAMWLLW